MLLDDTKLELNEDELSNVVGGNSVVKIMQNLMSLASKYPEIAKIFDAYQKGEYSTFLSLLMQFKMAHPELAYIFED